jgi:phosphoglycerate dehydrogenase-like enzyme
MSPTECKTVLRRATGISGSQAWSRDELLQQIPNTDVLVISGLWRYDLIGSRRSCAFSSRSALGSTSTTATPLRNRGIRLASARGVNERTVSEQAMALILTLARTLP